MNYHNLVTDTDTTDTNFYRFLDISNVICLLQSVLRRKAEST